MTVPHHRYSPAHRLGRASLLLSALTLLSLATNAEGSFPHSRTSTEFNEHIFRRKVSSALATVSRVLENTRSPRLATDVDDHAYEDKYSLAEFVTNSALAALVNALDRIGLDASKLSDLKRMVEQKKPVTLRFVANETCEFLEEKTVEIESPRQYETYETTEKGEVKEEKTTRSRIVNKVKEQHWSFRVEYTVLAYAGSNPDAEENLVTLKNRVGATEIVVSGNKNRPRPEVYTPPAREVDLTWFLKQLRVNSDDSKSTCQFSIDRTSKGCHTPRRNGEISDAEGFFSSLRQWGEGVSSYFTRDLRNRIDYGTSLSDSSKQLRDLNQLVSTNAALFVPVLPLFEDHSNNPTDEKPDSSSPLLSAGDLELFLNEQCRSIDNEIGSLINTFPTETGTELISSAEASLALVAMHSLSICDHFLDGVNSIENMLRSQLIRAIGKDLKPSDFDDFLRFYYSKMFKEPYVPEPFIYAIRRPHHYPDGTISIEGVRAGEGLESVAASSAEPIVTTTRKVQAESPMFLPISAATTIAITGDRFLHAWVRHDFSGSSQAAGVNLVARARQFSSFMLVLGTMSGPDSFRPENAIILQNKDEVLIPLLLEQLPTPKEFKDAIESLSPEQKRFATAFRDMQLSTSVFGVLLIQLKPQLEAVLGLPYDSLTKEIRLTQDLLALFIEHQIPSDLLTFDGGVNATVEEKVARVKTHVGAVQEMIDDAKKKELEDSKRKTDMQAEMKMQAAFTKGGDMYGDEELDEGAVDTSEMKRRQLRARGRAGRFNADHDDMPRMMMAGMVADSNVVAAAGMEDFGEIKLPPPTADGRDDESAHLRVRKGQHRTVAHSPPSDQSTPTAEHTGATGPESGNAIDFTQVPKQLDRNFEELDDAAALRPTKIRAGDSWKKKYQKSLLTSLQTKSLGNDEQKTERNKSFDLLDALSKSGALPIASTELHVMVAATHRFDKSLVDTVIQDNFNPIEKVERSLLIVSSTINGLPVAELVSDDRAVEVAKHSPALLDSKDDDITREGDFIANVDSKADE